MIRALNHSRDTRMVPSWMFFTLHHPPHLHPIRFRLALSISTPPVTPSMASGESNHDRRRCRVRMVAWPLRDLAEILVDPLVAIAGDR